MTVFSIDKAIVSSTHSIFYRNCHQGNLELAEEIEGLEDRLIPFASQIPFKYPEASFLRVESLPLTTEEKERIYSRNIVELIDIIGN